MGGACSSMTEEQQRKAKRNRELERAMHGKDKIEQEMVKLLLLGPGESGKSTVFKQAKILQKGGGFTEDELAAYRFIVFGNCITQMKVLVTASNKLGISVGEENRARATHLSSLPAGGDAWCKEVGEDIKMLWADQGIQETYAHRDTAFQLNDSAAYFFDRIDHIMEDGYIPSPDDVLRARVRSTGIEEAYFVFDQLEFRMLDVGGQRSERRKWIHCFEGVTAVLFCASLSAYDQTLREDDSQNRMKEAVLLFAEICNSPWFRETAFILFLNKLDLFKEKIQKVELSSVFPEYKGGLAKNADDWEKPADFIGNHFKSLHSGSGALYLHYTVAVDTKNIKIVFNAVQHTLMMNVLGEGFSI